MGSLFVAGFSDLLPMELVPLFASIFGDVEAEVEDDSSELEDTEFLFLNSLVYVIVCHC